MYLEAGMSRGMKLKGQRETPAERWARTPERQREAYQAVFSAVATLSKAITALHKVGGTVVLNVGGHMDFDPKAESCEMEYNVSVKQWGE